MSASTTPSGSRGADRRAGSRRRQRGSRETGLAKPVRRRLERNGLITYRELTVELGYSRGRVGGWVRRGHLVREQRRVYRAAGAPLTDRLRHEAARLRAGDAAKLGGVSGLGLLGAGDIRLADHTPFVVIRPGASLHNVDFDWLSAPLDSPDLAGLDGLPCTHPERLVIEAAGRLPEAILLAVVDDLRRRGMVRLDRLLRRARRLQGHVPGADDVLAMADRGAVDQESPTERRLAAVFTATDPIPAYQVRLLPHRRVDAVFLEARLVVEMLSDTWHGLPADRSADADRTAELERELGVKVIEVWPSELDHPSTLRTRLLTARTEQLRAGVAPLRLEELPR